MCQSARGRDSELRRVCTSSNLLSQGYLCLFAGDRNTAACSSCTNVSGWHVCQELLGCYLRVLPRPAIDLAYTYRTGRVAGQPVTEKHVYSRSICALRRLQALHMCVHACVHAGVCASRELLTLSDCCVLNVQPSAYQVPYSGCRC
jgi:hypothetical protein